MGNTDTLHPNYGFCSFSIPTSVRIKVLLLVCLLVAPLLPPSTSSLNSSSLYISSSTHSSSSGKVAYRHRLTSAVTKQSTSQSSDTFFSAHTDSKHAKSTLQPHISTSRFKMYMTTLRTFLQLAFCTANHVRVSYPHFQT